jgi:hypothetical protein
MNRNTAAGEAAQPVWEGVRRYCWWWLVVVRIVRRRALCCIQCWIRIYNPKRVVWRRMLSSSMYSISGKSIQPEFRSIKHTHTERSRGYRLLQALYVYIWARCSITFKWEHLRISPPPGRPSIRGTWYGHVAVALGCCCGYIVCNWTRSRPHITATSFSLQNILKRLAQLYKYTSQLIVWCVL